MGEQDPITQMVQDPDFVKMSVSEQRKALAAHDPIFSKANDDAISGFVQGHQKPDWVQYQGSPQGPRQDQQNPAQGQMLPIAIQGAKQAGIGAVKSATQTARFIGKSNPLGSLIDSATGGTGSPVSETPETRALLTPSNTMQNIGAGLEQTGEMMATGGPLKQGAEVLATKLPTFLSFAKPVAIPAARVAAESLNTGGNAALHGEEIGKSAAAGVAGGTIAESLPFLSNTLKKSAQKSYEAVINPTKETTKFDTQKIMPTLLQERPISATRQGLIDKASSRAEAAGQQIENKVAGMTGQQQTQPITDALENYRKKFQVNGTTVIPEVDDAVDRMQTTINQLGSSLSYQDAIKARRILDNSVNAAGGYSGKSLADASINATRKAAADSFRAEFAKANPDLAELNGKYHFWRTLEDTLNATALRKTGQTVPLGQMLETATAAGAGAAQHGIAGAGGYAAAMYYVGKFMRSTAWRTATGAIKSKLADALANGNFDTAVDLATRGISGQLGSSTIPKLGDFPAATIQ